MSASPLTGRTSTLSPPAPTEAEEPLPQLLDTHKYFPDLDGLRAVAVLPVIAYHAGVPWLPGGFVGVDVFYVLSGFFITRQLAGDLRAGRFSILKFYERRARRILPALFGMLAVTTVLAALILMPAELVAYGKTLLATLGFGSNVYFWESANYFDQMAALKPLLHTWSLAVEEQFYLFLPPLLWMLWQGSQKLTIAALVALAGISLALCIVVTPHSPVAAFYLGPFRAWELLAGSLLALAGARRIPAAVRHAVSIVCLGLLVGSFLLIDQQAGFPGWVALVPVVGSSGLVLASLAGGGIGNRMLAVRPLVFVGLISYSLYLWHWPFLALARNRAFGDPGIAVKATIVGGTFVCATLSWVFLERPFRGSRSRVTARRLVMFCLGGLALLSAAGGALVMTHGLPGRLKPAARAFLAGNPEFLDVCLGRSSHDIMAGRTCIAGQDGAPLRVAIWGDSHASRIAMTVDDIGKAQGFALRYTVMNSCPPLVGADWTSRGGSCRAFNNSVLDELRRSKVEVVVLAALWGNYAEGTSFVPNGIFGTLSDYQTQSSSVPQNRSVFRRRLLDTVRLLRAAGKHVLIIGPIPEMPWPVPERLAGAVQAGEPLPAGPSIGTFKRREAAVLSALRQAEAIDGVAVFYPHRQLCSSGRCAVTHAGKRLYFDDNHIDAEANKLLEPGLAQALEGLLKREVRPLPLDRGAFDKVSDQ